MRDLPTQRSRLERRCSRSAVLVLLLTAGYVLGAPIVHSAASRLLPGQPVTGVLYAPLIRYAFDNTGHNGGNWYLSYWVMCEHQVRKYV